MRPAVYWLLSPLSLQGLQVALGSMRPAGHWWRKAQRSPGQRITRHCMRRQAHWLGKAQASPERYDAPGRIHRMVCWLAKGRLFPVCQCAPDSMRPAGLCQGKVLELSARSQDLERMVLLACWSDQEPALQARQTAVAILHQERHGRRFAGAVGDD